MDRGEWVGQAGRFGAVEAIARVCHEASRGLQAAVPVVGIPVAPVWGELAAEERARVMEGVELALRGGSAEELHESWVAAKVADGWRWGPVKNADEKLHPCLVPYAALPDGDRVKDRLFAAIVGALA